MIKALLVVARLTLSADVGPAHPAVPPAPGARSGLLIEATQGQRDTAAPPAQGSAYTGMAPPQEPSSQIVLLLTGRSNANINQMVKRVFPARERAQSRI